MAGVLHADDLRHLFDAANAALARNDAAVALQFAQQAWALAPGSADVCNLIGVCAIGLGDTKSAEQCWLQALALAPDAVEPHVNLALHYADTAKSDEAERYFRRALELDEHRTQAHARLGLILAAAKRSAEAEACYRRALDLDPKDIATRSNLGVLLAAQGLREEAESCYRRALALDPQNAEACTNLGLLLEARGDLDEAEQCQRSAAGLNPASSAIQSNLANLLARMERFDEARDAYRQAIALDPESPVARSNFGVLLAHFRHDNDAEMCFRQALALQPGYQMARLNLAMLLLAQGRFDEGWACHEARYHPDLPDPDAPMPSLPFAQWQGEPLAGKSLLVWPEQGFGDLIQFCRYLPLLKMQGAARITLVCRSPLASLMCTVVGVDQVLSADDARALELHDFWTLPLSLPLHFHTVLSSIPAPIPYLHAPVERRAAWAHCLTSNDGKIKVGLVWRGNAMHANDMRRSLPGISILEPLWSIAGVQLISLQHGAATVEAQQWSADHPLLELGSKVSDFADTAAIVEQLDLLITVDTAVAHLAGALGTPCWVLLPDYRTDWRWLRERNDSPWYPGRMRLFRQAWKQDWSAVIEQVAQSLRDYLAGG
jgi:Flp pilus assembly protein TadD